MRATKRLAIYRDHSLNRLADPLHPLKKTRFKLFGIKVRKDTPKGIVRRNPVRQVEQFREPGFLRLPEFFDFYPSFCPTDHSANGQNDDIPQAMPFGSFHTRICHLRKDGFQVSEIFFFHLTVSRFLDLILSPPQYLDAIALAGGAGKWRELYEACYTTDNEGGPLWRKQQVHVLKMLAES